MATILLPITEMTENARGRQSRAFSVKLISSVEITTKGNAVALVDIHYSGNVEEGKEIGKNEDNDESVPSMHITRDSRRNPVYRD